MPEIHAAGYSPTIRKRAVSRKLVQARKNVGMTTTEVCKRLRWSPSKLNYIEKSKWIEPNSDAVADLCELYGIEGAEREALITLAREGRQRGWWSRYNDVFRDEFPGFEAGASLIRTFQNTFVPGLLQTREYIEAVTRAAGIDDPAEIERHVHARLERQRILTLPAVPTRLCAVVDENVIARIRPLELRKAQLKHLLDMTEQEHVELRLIPTAAGPYPGAGEAFTYLGFTDPAERDIVYLETTIDYRFLEEKDELRRFTDRFDRLAEAALSAEATRDRLLEEVRGAT
ncbi:helix-turn-helix domain-containing protein [Actinomadura rupiterrae]|uniref:helix-turn-helix domain-containing protein n=1 Tax=Actinomadura rupiterrae TaxID=559627 RepID=UPI0020A39EED|nr:helix-turn-helix transcriptional regulator [Actinomadura rupiterrae]MCP2335652.1 transcriptional regulator with XRE-family HTH domain [Actinomadura rupiterrae]